MNELISYREIPHITRDAMEAIAKVANSRAEFHNMMNIPYGGKYCISVNLKLDEYGLLPVLLHKPKDNFNNKQHIQPSKYMTVVKICPVCNSEFLAKKGSPREKTTCSRGCSNTHFRSGENHPNYISGNNYRTKCFIHHEKKCIICGEDKIVAVHHYDGDHKNNEIINLIPLCPTHHLYIHSKHKHIVETKIELYRADFIKNFNGLVGDARF